MNNPEKNSNEGLAQTLRKAESKKSVGKTGAAAACCNKPFRSSGFRDSQ